MNPAVFCLKRKAILISLTILTVLYGIYAFGHLGRLSYPDFTIKTAMITTYFPGASPSEMEELVTDVLEEAIQSMSEIYRIESMSQAGVSYITVEMLPTLKSHELPQVWDFLRKKIGDAQSRLPHGCSKPVVTDDFGDVYGIYYALSCSEEFAKGKTDAEQLIWLREQGKWLKKELLNVQEVRDIAKIDFYGVQQEAVYLEIPMAKLATRGYVPYRIMHELEKQNQVVDAGEVRIGNDRVRISPTGDLESLKSILNIAVSDSSGESVVTLGDLVEKDPLEFEVLEPPVTLFRFNGRPALAMGISTKAGGNVVFMGEDLNAMLAELRQTQWPGGLELDVIFDQAQNVTESVDAFLVNLYESLAIVIVLLMVFMGWRSGVLIGAVLLLTVLATFIVMYFCGITLQVISLGALIIALGMLVDNAIVVLEETLIAVQKGIPRETAAVQAVGKNQLPLLGATFIAILAFAAIGFAPDNIGEFCASLFQVLAISLLLSWVTAVTVLPLLCVWFLKVPKEIQTDPYRSPFYRVYRSLVGTAMRFRWLTLGGTAVLLTVSVVGFSRVPDTFFGTSTRNQFFIDYWRTEGTAIEVTSEDTRQIEAFLKTLPEVKSVSSFIGSGSLRYILTYEHRDPAPCFSQLLVTVDDWRNVPEIAEKVREFMTSRLPDGMPQVRFFREGPSVSYVVELEIRGREALELHRLSERVKEIFAQFPETIELRDDWRQKVMVLRPEIREDTVKRTGLSRTDISRAVHTSLRGMTVGWLRVGEDNIPILWRLPASERADVENLGMIQVYCPALNSFLRLDQLAFHLTNLKYEDPILRRVDRKPAITVQCNASGVPASVLREKLSAALKEADFRLPPGYEMAWRGEFEASEKGKKPLARIFPVCFLGMFLICVAMFNHLLQPLLIFLTVPLSVIGVTLGLLVTGHSFEFLCIPGFLGLSGMLIKNGIVLVTDTDAMLASGKLSAWDAVIETAVTRFRPVVLASGTTILGVAPLLGDAFYGALSAVIVGGLLAATLLTLVVLPVLYAAAHRIHPQQTVPEDERR